MNYLSIVLEQIEIFAVYVLIGVIAVKSHVLDRERLGVVSSCVTKILLPLLIFTNTVNGTTRGQFFSSSIIIVIAAALYLVSVLVKMVLAPLAVRTVLGRIPGVPLEIAVTVSILCALPCMSSLAMMAQDQHSDSDYAAGMILITTLASVVTIPLVCSLL